MSGANAYSGSARQPLGEGAPAKNTLGDNSPIRQGVVLYWLARSVALVAVLLVLTGCAIRLAPDYDASIVESLQKANEEAMVLFAGIAQGTGGKPFAQRAATYATVIGKLDALRIAVMARLPPPNPLPAGAASSTAPSADLISQASNTLATMRARDERKGLSIDDVSIFKERFTTAMHHALFYEQSLKR